MKLGTLLATMWGLSVLSACAELPPAALNYRYADTKLSIEVIRSVTCSSDNKVFELFKATPTVTYGAGDGVQSLHINKLDGALQDTDISVQLYDDGRLKSINSSSTGQGEAVVKSAAAVAIIVVSGGAIEKMSSADEEKKAEELCTAINKASAGGKVVSLTYQGGIDLSNPTKISKLSLEPESNAFKPELIDALGDLVAMPGVSSCGFAAGTKFTVNTIGKSVAYGDSEAPYSKDNERLSVSLRDPAIVDVTVCARRAKQLVWTGKVPVSQLGTPYNVYFAKPAPFGKETLTLSLNEAGIPTTIGYAATSGASSAFNAVNDAASVKQDSDSAELAKLKLKDDYTAEQERHVRCMADKTNCK